MSSLERQHRRDLEVVDPISGSLVDCSDPEQAAAFIEGLRLFKIEANKRIGEASGFLAEEMGRLGKNKIIAGNIEAERQADKKTTWVDVDEMLDELIVAGLPPEAQLELVETVVTRKVSGTVANRLARNNDAYKAIIEKHRQVEDNGWKVSTKPRKPA